MKYEEEYEEDWEEEEFEGESQEESKEPRKKKQGGTWLLCFFLLAISVVNFTSRFNIVPTESMASTIEVNDILFTTELPYLVGEPGRFDIIVFKYPLDESVLYVKRVIGLPGEHVEIKEGAVYVDGVKLGEDYLPEAWTEYNDGYVFDVPEGCYFVMGDNRNKSFDSRFWANQAVAEGKCSNLFADDYTYVKKSAIVGQAVLKVLPSLGGLG